VAAVLGFVGLLISDETDRLRDRLGVLWAAAPGLVGSDHHVCCHKEGSVLW